MISQVLVEIIDFGFEGFTGHTIFLENCLEFLLELKLLFSRVLLALVNFVEQSGEGLLWMGDEVLSSCEM